MPAARRKPPPLKDPPEPEPDREPDIEERVRTAKYKKMETSVQGFYIMLGGALSVLPNEVAGSQFKRIGKSFAIHSEEIADAWIDLAEDDARVRRIIESVTGFSTWGKVVGRHLEAIGDETPAVQGLRATQQQPTGPAQQSDDIQAAMALAQWIQERAAQERAAQGNGQQQQPQPTEDQLREAAEARAAMTARQRRGRPMRQQQQQPVNQQPQHPMGQGRPTPIDAEQAPPMGQTRKPVGMPTPADLGVTIADSPEDFPAGGSQDVRG